MPRWSGRGLRPLSRPASHGESPCNAYSPLYTFPALPKSILRPVSGRRPLMAITPLDMGASHDPVRTRRLDAVPRLPGGIPDGAGRGAEEPRPAARVVAFSTRPRREGTRGPEDGAHAPGNDRHQE